MLDAITFKGAPSSVSMVELCAAKQSGISSCEVGSPSRSATTITIGSNAATVPFTLMVAVASAARSMSSRNARVLLPADFSTNC